jgi:hypothetical protein
MALENAMTKISLGLVPLPSSTIEHDFVVLGKFQEYSAELLRLALIGVSAVGVVVSQTLLGKKQETEVALTTLSHVRWWLIVALALFCLSSFGALWHRFAASDSMAWHLEETRRAARADESDATEHNLARVMRRRRFRDSQWALKIAAVSLAGGAAALASALGIALSN